MQESNKQLSDTEAANANGLFPKYSALIDNVMTQQVSLQSYICCPRRMYLLQK